MAPALPAALIAPIVCSGKISFCLYSYPVNFKEWLNRGVIDMDLHFAFLYSAVQKIGEWGKTPPSGFLPPSPFFLAFGRLGEFRSLRRATRALPSTHELFEKSSIKNFG